MQWLKNEKFQPERARLEFYIHARNREWFDAARIPARARRLARLAEKALTARVLAKAASNWPKLACLDLLLVRETRAGKLLVELVDTASGIDEFHLAGEVRVRLSRDFKLDHRVLLTVFPDRFFAASGA